MLRSGGVASALQKVFLFILYSSTSISCPNVFISDPRRIDGLPSLFITSLFSIPIDIVSSLLGLIDLAQPLTKKGKVNTRRVIFKKYLEVNDIVFFIEFSIYIVTKTAIYFYYYYKIEIFMQMGGYTVKKR